ncbi:DUF4280 domain-containing protein [Aquimarina agarivorans]|uniref:DUF4280 domain-containing protein n=1 Tax=Aquimarina agarivorans TaxID=980584 RepID=UPI000248E8D2|nr:DUF4280 domain-containing protein [Aquimarina agarivorans]
MSEKKLVCQGAICKCSFGDFPDKLVVSSQQKHYINDTRGSQKLMATDKELGAPFQTKTFGQCKMQPTGSSFKPCMPAITTWNGFFEKTQIQSNQGFPLLENSKGICSFGGTPSVEITFHGQVAVPSAQNIANADPEVLSQIMPLINVNEIDTPDPYGALQIVDDSTELDEENKHCTAGSPPEAPLSIIGTCQYYKWRFNNFMERHDKCQHDPPDYYYGPLREIEGGLGFVDTINEWWTPSLEEEMGNEKLVEYKKPHGTFRGVPSESYGYKYCVRFTNVLMPELSPKGKEWLKKAKKLLQKYMEEGVVEKEFISVRNTDFNERYSLANNAKAFYTGIENRNDEFRDFAFATHPDAYLDAGLTGIPISDKIKVSLTPDFKEWASGKTWEQAMLVMEEQINDWYKQAEAGLKEVQKDIEETIEEAEKYLELFKDSIDIWRRINRELDKYRNMPWLN